MSTGCVDRIGCVDKIKPYRQGLQSLQRDVVGEGEIVHIASGHYTVAMKLHRTCVEDGVLGICCISWIVNVWKGFGGWMR